jgi:membrane protease YdiL (CAAX protease family)
MLSDSSKSPWWRWFVPKKEWGMVIGVAVALLALYGPWFLLEPIAPVIVQLPLDRNARIAIITSLAGVISLSVVVAALAMYGKKLRDIGFTKPTLLHLAKALAGFAMYFVISIIFAVIGHSFFGLNTEQPQQLGYSAPNGIGLVLAFISLVMVAPLSEEAIFRGFLFTGFRRQLPFWTAALGVSAIFGLVHGQWNVGLDVFAMSLISCYLVEKTKSLWPSIFLHAVKNGVAFYLIYLYNGS